MAVFTFILPFCSYVEHGAYSSIWFYPKLVLLPLFSYFQTSAVPILLFFSRLFLVYLSSLYPEGSSPLRVFLMHLVVYVVHGQSNAIFLPLIIVQQVFVLFSAIISHSKFYSAIWRLKYVVGIGWEWITYPFSYCPNCIPYSRTDLTYL